MDQPFCLLGQAERCRRLARDSTDAGLSDRLLKLAEEYTARASAGENDRTAVWLADADDQGTE
jgi:erythromycin esterase-like protein